MKKARLFAILFTAFLFVLLAAGSAFADEIVVAFEKKEYTVLAGKELKVAPVIQGTNQRGKAVYASSDESVATANNGSVRGVTAGTATISCTVTIGEETYECSFELTVLQPVARIEVPTKAIEMPTSGRMREPVAVVYPEDASNKELEYSTSNDNIAWVTSDGIVCTGHLGGTATITCKATDGSGVKATFQIKVPKVAWFTCPENIEIDDPEGYVFYYKPTYSRSFNTSNSYCANENITSASAGSGGDPLADFPFTISGGFADDMTGVRIIPVKAGGSKYVVKVNGGKAAINIKVTRNAVYEDLPYEQFERSAEKAKGLRYHIPGVVIAEEKTETDRYIIFGYGGDEAKPVKMKVMADYLT